MPAKPHCPSWLSISPILCQWLILLRLVCRATLRHPSRRLSISDTKTPPGVCRWCGLDVHRFSSRRHTFCCEECVHEFRLRSDPNYASMEVFKRDKGICCLCGLDTTELLTELLYHIAIGVCPNWMSNPEGALHRAHYLASNCFRASNFIPRKLRTSRAAVCIEASFLTNNGFKPYKLVSAVLARKRLWEADHINPVFLGGGQCGLDNFRTLCYWCHKKVTIEQAKARASEK